MLEQIKSHLLESIETMVSFAKQFVLHPDKAFNRHRQLDMKTMIKSILAMGSSSLAKALLDLGLPLFSGLIRLNLKLLPTFLRILQLKFQLLIIFLF